MPRMSDGEIQSVFDDYNKLRARRDYWVGAGMALVEYLHLKHGMRYSDIYAIAESAEYTKAAKKAMQAPRVAPNVTALRGDGQAPSPERPADYTPHILRMREISFGE